MPLQPRLPGKGGEPRILHRAKHGRKKADNRPRRKTEDAGRRKRPAPDADIRIIYRRRHALRRAQQKNRHGRAQNTAGHPVSGIEAENRKRRPPVQPVAAGLHGIRGIDRVLQRPGDQHREDRNRVSDSLYQVTAARVPADRLLPVPDNFRLRVKAGHKPEHHGQNQRKRRNDAPEQVDKLVRRHHDVAAGKPQDGDKKHRGEDNAVDNRLDRDRPCFQIKQKGHAVVVEQGVDQRDQNHCRNRIKNIKFQHRPPAAQAPRIAERPREGDAKQYRMGHQNRCQKHHQKIHKIYGRMAGRKGIRPAFLLFFRPSLRTRTVVRIRAAFRTYAAFRTKTAPRPRSALHIRTAFRIRAMFCTHAAGRSGLSGFLSCHNTGLPHRAPGRRYSATGSRRRR